MVLPPWRQQLQSLSDQDLWFLVTTCADRRTDHDRIVEMVRDKPDFLEVMMDDEKLFRRLASDREAVVKVSPFVLFSVLLRQARRDLADRSFVLETEGRDRIPVFAADQLRALLGDGEMRDYLAEMLASFVRTHTATVYFRRRGAWYRHRFSDLDLDDLAALAEWVEEEFRFPFYKRLGDVALFIPGVFPEHAPPRGQMPRGRRGRRSLEDYEEAGRHFYGLAAAHPAAGGTGYSGVLGRLREQITLVRRLLNFLSDRYLNPQKMHWFLAPTT